MTETVPADSSEASPDQSNVLPVARHVVGFFLVMSATWFLNSPPNLIRWAVVPLAAVILSAAFAGLLALFFTTSQAGKVARNFKVALWILGACWLMISWAAHSQRAIEAEQPNPAPPAQAPNPFSDPNFGKELPKQ